MAKKRRLSRFFGDWLEDATSVTGGDLLAGGIRAAAQYFGGGTDSSEEDTGSEKKNNTKEPSMGKESGKKSSDGGKKAAPKSTFKDDMAALARTLLGYVSAEERNAFVVELLGSENQDGVKSFINIEKQMIDDKDHPSAENRFMKVVAKLVADARKQCGTDTAKFAKFLNAFLDRAKSDPDGFKMLIEMSNNDGIQQHVKTLNRGAEELAGLLKEKRMHAERTWVRGKRKQRTGIVSGFLRQIVSSITAKEGGE